MADDKRKQLLDFIDNKVFNPVLEANPGKYSDEDKKKLEDIQRKTKNEQKQFHNDYTTAKDVKDGYLSDVRSEAAQKINKELSHLKLPTLPQHKDEFTKLCDKIGV